MSNISVQCGVTNKNSVTIADRFDGVPFVFEKNRRVVIPGDAAAHIFGWTDGGNPEDCKKHTCRRFGWQNEEMVLWSKIHFEKVVYKTIEVVEEEAPAVIETKGGPKMSAG